MCPLPDSEIETRKLLKSEPSGKSDDETDGEKERHIPTHNTELTTSSKSPRSMLNPSKRKQPISHTSHAPCRKLRYPCKTRQGMSAAADTAWHKRGFDSLTSHTFFMSKAKYGKRVIKSVVHHRICGTCYWWRRNRPSVPVRKHRCVRNHVGSAKLMECKSGVHGIKELSDEGTPVEVLEGDGDTTMLAHIKTDLNRTLKKRDDRNHIVKNIGKNLYAVKKLSKSVIQHLQKCLKYAFAKNAGDKTGMEENLRAIIPHQFG